jgi:hypothetical protein
VAFGIKESIGLGHGALVGKWFSLFEFLEEFKHGFVVGHGDCCLRFRLVKRAKDEGEEISRLMEWR